ncbi:hypothetical protein TNCV_860531 [Trichonephila clavipes]|nr:hypothetical protein TNCV_860531 [Trichonephila clavipes]
MLSSRPGAIYQQDNARPHTEQCLMTSQHEVTRSFANRACSGRVGKATAPSRDTGELTAQMQRLWLFHRGHGESMPRRISSCQRWLYYLLIFNLLQAVTA